MNSSGNGPGPSPRREDARRWLSEAVAAGFPPSVLIPLTPPDAVTRFVDVADLGKQPATFGEDGFWHPVKWGQGVADADWGRGCLAGANAGLRMGTVCDRGQFVFVDVDPVVDTDEGPLTAQAEAFSQAVVRLMSAHLGAALWVRQSRRGRAGVLFRLPAAADPGRKTVTAYVHDDKAIGKIEILTAGQQAAIGGVHVSGREMFWYRSDTGAGQPFPDVETMPRVDSFEAVIAAVDHVTAALGGFGIAGTRSKVRTAVQGADGLVAPSGGVDDLCRLLETLPHDVRVSRDQGFPNWIGICVAAVGAALALGLQPGSEDWNRVRGAVTNWSCKWTGPAGETTTWTEQAEKWDTDWGQRQPQSSWPQLVAAASALGDDSWRLAEAGADFLGVPGLAPVPRPEGWVETLPKPTPAPSPLMSPAEIELLTSETSTGHVIADPDVGLVAPPASSLFVPTADICMAEVLGRAMTTRFVWVDDEGRWLGTDEHGAWSGERGGTLVRSEIALWLKSYVTRFLGQEPDTIKAKALSRSRVDSMEILLKSKLAKISADTHVGELVLQTPGGAYDLRDGGLIPGREQRLLIDTRRTTTTPGARGPTPLVDGVIDHLCGGDGAVIAWFWAYLGYLALGKPLAHVLLILEGPGGNGKGTICRIIKRMMGSYAIEADRKVLLASAAGAHSSPKYDLRYRRLWYVDELPPNEKWNEADLKALSGGNEIQARRMHRDNCYFKAEGTFLVATNSIPTLHRIDDAIARRFRIIKCAKTVPQSAQNKLLEFEVYDREAPAILARIMDEARAVYEAGFKLPATPRAMALVTEDYFAEIDTYYTWFERECEIGDADEVMTFAEARTRYEAYCRRRRPGEEQGMMSTSTLSTAGLVSRLRGSGVFVDGASSPPKFVKGLRFRVSAVA